MSEKPNPDWYGVEDKQERKRIQDRLAQRARRMRSSAEKQKSKRPTQAIASHPRHLRPAPKATVQIEAPIQARNESTALVPHLMATTSPREITALPAHFALASRNFTPASTASGSPALTMLHPHPQTDPTLLPLPSLTLCSALHINGLILRLTCRKPLYSPPIDSDASEDRAIQIPPSLHPTNLQRTVIHAAFIDALPLPKVRDKLILYQGLMDEDDFAADLVSIGPTFVVSPEFGSWDPRGWKVDETFRRKWSFLFE